MTASSTVIKSFGPESIDDSYQKWLKDNPTNGKEPIAAVVRVGGSGTDMLISGLHETPDHLLIQAGRSVEGQANHSADLAVVKQILTTLTERATAASQSIMDVVFGVAGFATKADRVRASSFGQKSITGHIYMPNAYDGGTRGLDWDALSYVNSIKTSTPVPPGRVDIAWVYNDEAGNQIHPKQLNAKTNLKVTILNDTVAVAASAAPSLKEGENALGLVCGSGLNFGICKDFNKATGDFRESTNTEAGHDEVPVPAANLGKYTYASPLDLIEVTTLRNGRPLTIEESFAGESLVRQYQTLKKLVENGDIKAISKVVRYLNRFLDSNEGDEKIGFKQTGEKIQLTLNKVPGDLQPADTGEAISRAALRGDPIAQALTLSLATRLANVTIHKFGDLLKNPKTTALAMTGSHLLHGIFDVPKARDAFIGTIQNFRSQNSLPDLRIIEHEREAMDGMRGLLAAKVALAHTAAKA